MKIYICQKKLKNTPQKKLTTPAFMRGYYLYALLNSIISVVLVS